MSLYKVELRLQKLEEFTYEAIDQLNSLKNLIRQQNQQSNHSIQDATFFSGFGRSSIRHRTITISGDPKSTAPYSRSHQLPTNSSFPCQNPHSTRLLNHSFSNIETRQKLNDIQSKTGSNRKRIKSEIQETEPKAEGKDGGLYFIYLTTLPIKLKYLTGDQ